MSCTTWSHCKLLGDKVTLAWFCKEYTPAAETSQRAHLQEYFGTQPWLAVPYSEELLRTKLRQRYEVDGIPHLVMLDPNGKVLCSNARTGIMADPQGHKFPWASHSNMR